MILRAQTLRHPSDARHLAGWHVIYVAFGAMIAEQCDSSESADRVASTWTAHGVACTVLNDGKPA